MFYYITVYIENLRLSIKQATFTGFSDSYAVPAGVAEPLFSGSVDLILSTGITQQVFDTLSTALKRINFMEQQKNIVYHQMKMLLPLISDRNF